MTNFMFAFHGGEMPKSEEAKAKIMKSWGDWMENLGTAIVDPGSIINISNIVSASGISDDVGPEPMTGYMIVTAADQSAAVKMAQGCPILQNQGNVRIAQLVQP